MWWPTYPLINYHSLCPHPLPKWLTVIPIAPTQCWWRWQQSSSLTAWLELPPVRPVNWVSSPPPPPPSSSTSPPPHPSSPTFKKLNSTKLFHHHNHILPTTLPTTLKAYSGSWKKFCSWTVQPISMQMQMHPIATNKIFPTIFITLKFNIPFSS